MSTTDSNGLVIYTTSDPIEPIQTVFNNVTTSVTNAFNSTARTFKVDNQAARDALAITRPPSLSNPLYVYRKDTGVTEYNLGSGWVTPGVEVSGTITYGSSWRAPTTASITPAPEPLTVYKVGNRVCFSGSIENAAVLSSGTYGQFTSAFTIPVGFRPANTVVIPATANVAATFLALGQVIISSAGVATLQTTTAWPSTPIGNGRFDIGSRTWVATS